MGKMFTVIQNNQIYLNSKESHEFPPDLSGGILKTNGMG